MDREEFTSDKSEFSYISSHPTVSDSVIMTRDNISLIKGAEDKSTNLLFNLNGLRCIDR